MYWAFSAKKRSGSSIRPSFAAAQLFSALKSE
jgi:hypothetical protein